MVKLNIKLKLNPNLHQSSNKLRSLKSPSLFKHLSPPPSTLVSVVSMLILSRAHSMPLNKCNKNQLLLNNKNLKKLMMIKLKLLMSP